MVVYFLFFLEGYRNLTGKYLEEEFNPKVKDHPDVMYYSAIGGVELTPLDVLYVPYCYIKAVEGNFSHFFCTIVYLFIF